MQEYVLGFVFNDGEVLLVERDHGPDLVQGTRNGLGGRIKKTDRDAVHVSHDVSTDRLLAGSPDLLYKLLGHAMQRSFEQETGITIAADQWRYCGWFGAQLEHPDAAWKVHVLTHLDGVEVDGKVQQIPQVPTNTVDRGEPLDWYPIDDVTRAAAARGGYVYNLPWLVPMAADGHTFTIQEVNYVL